MCTSLKLDLFSITLLSEGDHYGSGLTFEYTDGDLFGFHIGVTGVYPLSSYYGVKGKGGVSFIFAKDHDPSATYTYVWNIPLGGGWYQRPTRFPIRG